MDLRSVRPVGKLGVQHENPRQREVGDVPLPELAFCRSLARQSMKYDVLAPILVGLCTSAAMAQWQTQTVGTKADLRGLSVVSAKVAWVSGTHGMFARTIDAGKT